MKYIGIDSSLSCTGIAVLTRNGLGQAKLLQYGKIRSSKEDPYIVRCTKILKEIEEVVSKVVVSKEEIIVCIETPNSFRNGIVTRELCGLYGMILYMLKSTFNLDARELNTKHIKAVASGDGAVNKVGMVNAINKTFKLSLTYNSNKDKSDDDIADAIAIAMTGMKDDNPSTKTKRGKK